MSTREDIWAARLHAAVDDHEGADAFDVESYVAAGRRRVRRGRAAAVAGAVAVLAVVLTVVAVATEGLRDEALPVVPAIQQVVGRPSPNGWIALDEGGDVYLVRPGGEARRVSVPGSSTADEACPAWSRDGAKVVFGRYRVSGGDLVRDPVLVVVPVDRDGVPGSPTTIALDGFGKLEGFDPHPCATWADDGRWVALIGAGEVWVVDTQGTEVRRVPGLRPRDLEWRPGTDELTIAGDWGRTRAAPTLSTAVSTYSVSSGELRQLGAVRAAQISWSPDGTQLVYVGGESDSHELRLVGADGRNDRFLTPAGAVNHGTGPEWSPLGDRIAYQRLVTGRGEAHVVVLVDVDTGRETVIDPPLVGGSGGRRWYPSTSWWSPDGTALVYSGWYVGGGPGDDGGKTIVVPVDSPEDATYLSDLGSSAEFGVENQSWGSMPS